jgi:WD40 repeat protein
VQELVGALERRGQDVWVDWEDIRKSADWRAKIEEGVESSRVIVAVLTPEFASSEVCAVEIEHAVSQNKRIVPVVRREPDRGRLRDELNAPNWIFLRESDDFEAAVDELVEAVDADLEWLDQHARLLVRAVEWDRRQRNPSLLLRGSDLEAAERWLASQGAHTESPTALQGEYIVASRRNATKRQRVTLGSIALALAVALGLAALAVVLWRQAVQRERVARSRELAANATSELSSDPELSVVLAAKAMETKRTPEAEQVLRRSLSESSAAATLCGHRSFVNSAAFSHDGKVVATASSDGTARLWDVPTGRLRSTLSGHTALLSRVVFSPDDGMVATVSDDRTARLWDVRTGRAISILGGHFGEVVDAAFSPDGRLLVTAGSDGALVWDIARGQGKIDDGRLLDQPGDVTSVAFSPDGRLIATTSGDRTARLWTAAGEPVAELPGHREGLTSVVFNPAGTLVATTSFDGTARLWDVPSGRLVHVLRGHAWSVLSGAFSPDGKEFVTTSMDSTARVWDVASGRDVSVLRGHTGWVKRASFSPDGKLVLTASEDGTARLWEAASGLAVGELRGHHGAVDDASFSPSGRYVVTGSDDGTGRLWRTDNWALLGAYGTGTRRPGDSVSFSADGHRLLTVSGGQAHLWNVTPRRRLGDFSFPSRFGIVYLVTTAALSPDGNLVAIAGSDVTPRLVDAGTGRVRGFLRGHTSEVSSIGFSRDGGRIVTASLDATARVWDTASGRSLAVLRPGGNVATAAFDPSASRVVTAGATGKGRNADYRVAIWNVATGRRIAAHDQDLPVRSAAFSPDGKLVLETGGRSTATIFDPATGTAATVFRGHSRNVLAGSFSPDGQLAVTAAEDGTAQIWETGSGQPVHVFRVGDPGFNGVFDV